jgi:hypothetical protein
MFSIIFSCHLRQMVYGSPAERSRNFARQMQFIAALLYGLLADSKQFVRSFIPTTTKLF